MGRHGGYNKKPHPSRLEIPNAVTDVLGCYQYQPAPQGTDYSYYPKPFNVAVVRVKRADGPYEWEVFSHPEEIKLDRLLREKSKIAQGFKVFVKYTGLNKEGMERIERAVGHHQGKNPPDGYDTVLSHQTPKDVDDQVRNIRRKISNIRTQWDLLERF